MLKINNRTIKQFPLNQWLEGNIVDVRENGKHRQFMEIVIKWNELTITKPLYVENAIKQFLNLANIPLFDFTVDPIDIDLFKEKLIGKVFGFKVKNKIWEGRAYPEIVDITSYAEQGYYQALYR